MAEQNSLNEGVFLVLGGTGKVGRRVAQQLKDKGVTVRIGSRGAQPAFDWNDETTWAAALEDVTAAYVSYAPDLAIPGATTLIQRFVDVAVEAGVERLVLLSGRGEEEAQACERIVQDSGVEWTVVRSSWFNQNFSEGEFVGMVQAGQITLPDVATPEPFVDTDDIAEVAVAALTQSGHAGEIYEVTGPRLLTLADVAAEISRAAGRTVTYVPVPHEAFVAGVAESGAPKDIVWILNYLFETVLDGRNAYVTDGVQRALGRPAKDFADYARDVAATGAWKAVA